MKDEPFLPLLVDKDVQSSGSNLLNAPEAMHLGAGADEARREAQERSRRGGDCDAEVVFI